MAQGRSQFVGLCGTYFVAYCVTSRGLHAAMTVGNAPNIDMLVSSVDGKRLLSLQVNTSTSAHKSNRYGRELWEWQLPASSGQLRNDSLWYAFVDLREQGEQRKPEVFLVPSHWVADFADSEWETWGRKLYWLFKEVESQCKERWDLVQRFLDGDNQILKWIREVPPDAKRSR